MPGSIDFARDVIPVLQEYVPQGAINLLRRAGLYRYGFRGNYLSWDEAQRASGRGYLDDGLVPPIAADTAALVESQRHNVSIASASLGLLAGLMVARRDQQAGAPISVLDFGGSLGNHYLELRRFIDEPLVSWLVCETPMLAEVGAARYGSDELRFTTSLADAQGPFTAVICSGALQCVPEPLSVLRELLTRSKWVLLDFTPLTNHRQHRLSVQYVPPWLHKGRYPIWFFSKELFSRELQSLATVAMQWAKAETIWYEGETIAFQGLLLRSKLVE